VASTVVDELPDTSSLPPPRTGADAAAANESIRRNATFAFLTQIATSVFTAALTVFLVRALEPTGYGLFALALAISGLVAIVAELGITQSVSRFVAESRSRRSVATRVVADGLALKIVVAAAASIALFAAAGWIAEAYGEPRLTWPLRGMALALFGQSVMHLVRGIFIALARNAVNFRLVVAESAVETGASVALVLLGGGAAGAAFGRAVGYFVGAVLGVAVLAAVLGRGALAFRSFRWERARRMARYAGALAIVDGAFVVFGQVDALVVGAFRDTTAVGVYTAPLRFVVFLQYPGLAVANAVAPRLARSGTEEPAVAAFVRALRYLIVFQAILIPPLLVWAEPITDVLLGSGYEDSASVLRALTPFVFLSGIAPLVSLTANYLGEARRRIPIALATLAIDLVLALTLVPTIGIVGAAIATDVAYALYVPAHVWICRRLLPVPLRPILLTLTRSAAAAAVMAGVLAVFGISDLSAADWVLGSVLGTAAFVAVLLATRELGPPELRAVWSLAVRRRS
jgi:O-antigen/teichoic acid export membrane protein